MADKAADPRGYDWETWSDFRAGIISQARFAYGANDNIAAVPFTGQPAAAQAEGTFGCIALPNGGLGPMPGLTATFMGPSTGAFQDGVNNWITGALVYGEISSTTGGNPGDELLYCIESVLSNSRLQAICATQTGGSWNRVLHSKGPAAASNSATQVYAFTAAMTMTNPSDDTGALTGTAGVVMTTAFLSNAHPAIGYLAIYPDPSNPGTTTTPHDYSADLPVANGEPSGGVVLAHQNRIIFFQQNEYLWTTGAALTAPFDQIYYTDPPNTVPGNGNGTSLAQDVVFVQEWPVGAGAWGSISAGELFIVKHRGGGYILSGDLNNPTVTWLGGVTPTYGQSLLAAPTLVGLAYSSGMNGIWIWNGSNVSTKISNQLNDDFFEVPVEVATFGPQGALQSWAELIITPNNYVFDTTNGGWWKLDDQTVPYSWFGLSNTGDGLYCFPNHVTEHTQPIAYLYSRSAPTSTWQWMSYPLQVSKDHSVTVREIVLRAQGAGAMSVTVLGVNDAAGGTVPVEHTFTTTAQPETYRFDAGTDGLRAQDLTITVAAIGTDGGPAPIMYSISIGYTSTKPLNAT